jgi:protoheme IX farnesyltransferase
VTWTNTLVGAIPGALPPLMGWTAARGDLSWAGFSLFAVLAFWQIPHFFAIAWMYRGEYAKAGFKMLPSIDPDGRRTGRQAVGHSLALAVASLCPFFLGLAGSWYFAGALLISAGFLWCAVQFARHLNMDRARHLFFASIIYLPLLLGALVIDKIK